MFLDSFEILLGFLQGIFLRFQGNQRKIPTKLETQNAWRS